MRETESRCGDKFVTVIIDLMPVKDGTGPARLLDMVQGRSRATFKTWLAGRPQAWRDAIDIVATDGFSGFKTAAAEELPTATTVLDTFHVVRLAVDALDQCRRRVQQAIHGHRGRKGEPLYMSRQTLHAGAELLTERQAARLRALSADTAPAEHAHIHATWGVYQPMVAAYRAQDRKAGKAAMTKLIHSLTHGVTAARSSRSDDSAER